MMRKFAAIFPCLALILMMSIKAHADAESGTFDMSGQVTFTASTTTWASAVSPAGPNAFILFAGTGSFLTADGRSAVSTVTASDEPTGTSFAAQPFIGFTQDPTLPGLDIDSIDASFPGACGGPPFTSGTTCTLPSIPFVTITIDPGGDSSSLSWVYSGVTSDGLSDWSATFTSQFNGTPQAAQTDLADGGFQNSYSATVDVTPIPVAPAPEPSTWLLLSTALGLLMFRRKFVR